MSDSKGNGHVAGSSARVPQAPPVSRRVWILGQDPKRLERAAETFVRAGHQVRTTEAGGDLQGTSREFHPDLIVIDMEEEPDRGRHAAVQLRADRATRQLPIVLVGVAEEERARADKAATGPTRRYVLGLDAPSVLNALVCDL